MGSWDFNLKVSAKYESPYSNNGGNPALLIVNPYSIENETKNKYNDIRI